VTRRHLRSLLGDRSPSRHKDGIGADNGTAPLRPHRRRRPRRVAAVLASALAVATFAAACGDDNKAAGTGSGGGGGEKIVLGYSAWPGWFPWKVAEEKGLFAKNGVNVQLKWFDSYPDSVTALSSGVLDANSQTLNETVTSVSGGNDQVIVLTNDNSTGNDKIIASADIHSIADLKGKKFAVEQGYVDHFLLLLALEKAGVSADDVKIVPLLTDQAAAAFKAGQVDAVGVYAPSTTVALQRPGSHVLTDSRDFPGAIPDHLVVSRDLLNSNPAGVQGLVNTWFDTLEYIKTHRDEAVRIMANRAGTSVEDYLTYDKGTTIFTREQNIEAFTPGNTDKNLNYEAKKIAKFLAGAGLAEKEPDLSKLFDPTFIQKAG
jgi:NitT/TauT family transport system substrate-binding protein